ncbi:MAG: 23S rRNA (guanosine(2251)-2'-O)-methyltransferase RlmB [Bacteroidota bacterium]|nr:23S rRNA (guanosine(2251)-2'-O)-methyltransferase RlmB [Bacteroidota bacterium]
MRYKEPAKMNYIYGLHSVLEAIHLGKEMEKVFIRKSLNNERSKELIRLLRERDIPVQFVPNEKLQRISSKNHQGVIGLISMIEYGRLEVLIPGLFEKGEIPFILILDEITDVRNLGAIARTAEFAGAHALVIPAKGSAQINADTIKTSSGALHKLPVCRTPELADSLTFLKNSGLKIIAGTEKAEKLYFDSDLSGPVAIVLGSEEKGISNKILLMADQLVRIPQFGKVDSLNVSVAAGVLCYEVIRQRQLSSS